MTSMLNVPHSAGVDRPLCQLPAGACDSHMHVFDPRFAASAHWQKRPPEADVSCYRLLQERLGLSRTVVVTPSTYGTDNSCTLDALEQLGQDARGVAVVEQSVSAAELDRLDSRGVRGLRVNFVSPQSWGTTTPEMLVTLAAKAAQRGWHVQVLLSPAHLVSLEAVLAELPATLVIDHMGLVDPADGEASSALGVLLRLLERGRTWIKLSGVYMGSREGAPEYRDANWLGQTFAREAPERLIWGSDWPHTTEPAGSVNAAHLVDVLRVWAGSDAQLARILVDNPAELYGFARTD